MTTSTDRLSQAYAAVHKGLVRLGLPAEDVAIVLREKYTPAMEKSTGEILCRVLLAEQKSVRIQYTNNTANFATLIVRVGSNDRPDRVVAPGKTVTSSYTTTIKTGFTGQKLVVTHKESGVVVLEQTL